VEACLHGFAFEGGEREVKLDLERGEKLRQLELVDTDVGIGLVDFFLQPDGSLPDRAMRPLEEMFHL